MENTAMQQNMNALIRKVFFCCCFFSSVLLATEDKAIYCINKEEPENLILVSNIKHLFFLPDTVADKDHCEMISIFAGVTVAEKESAMPSLMIKGGGLGISSNILLDSNGKKIENRPPIFLSPKKLPDQQYLDYPDAIQEKKAVRVIFPNKEESFIAPATWKFAVECKSGEKIKFFTSAEIFISGFCTEEDLKPYLKKWGKRPNSPNTSNCVEPTNSSDVKENNL
jgi:hypothetical protein